MKFPVQQSVRACILLAFSILLFHLHYTGEITKFINPKYKELSQIAAILFLILFIIQLIRIIGLRSNRDNHSNCAHDYQECHHDHHHHDHGDSPMNVKKLIPYVIICFPIFTGFVLPAKVLDSAIANKKGGMAVLSNERQGTDQTADGNRQDDGTESGVTDHNIDLASLNKTIVSREDYENLKKQLQTSSKIIMSDTLYSTYYEEINMNLSKYEGRKIELNGFVYKESGFEKDQLVLSRFLITHCVADSSIIGFLSEFPEASAVKEDTWLKASGVIELTDYNGVKMPLIKITEWEEISEPEEPYLYPLDVEVL
ncbi:TIGR03943 family putative permease subunit [Bacillus massiliglaciei]|uniref:TIGR03943 family putative permease subunit n=1 Tax=Bacillus massiliglaciei TaxID=1816693 RepID=UPI000A83FFA1|nr:TIGR03943 family protein [Bacillus massiliglaciei]